MKNKLTEGSNLIWESSRMMLPEHKALLRQHEENRSKKHRPDYDEQMLAAFLYEIELAYIENRIVKLTYYESDAHHQCVGRISDIDRDKQQIQFVTETEKFYFYLTELVSIE